MACQNCLVGSPQRKALQNKTGYMERQARLVNLRNIMSRTALPSAKVSSTEICASSW